MDDEGKEESKDTRGFWCEDLSHGERAPRTCSYSKVNRPTVHKDLSYSELQTSLATLYTDQMGRADLTACHICTDWQA